MNGPRLHGEIESPRPLHATGGQLTVAGWCLLAGAEEPPVVRLVTPATIIPMTDRCARPDLAPLFPAEPAAARAGFRLQGSLPAGVHLARFEARLPDGTWQGFKQLTIVADRLPLQAALDEPISTGTLRDRVKVGGWALHASQPLRALSLRYGHREVPCVLGQPRADVAAAFPSVRHATQTGFVSEDYLVAGHGPVRIKATLADGRTMMAPTDVCFSIATDENHPANLDLTATRIGLPRGSPPTANPPPPTAPRPFNILFVLYGNFISNSANQVTALAQELTAAGHHCAITVPRDPETAAYLEKPRFTTLLHAEAITTGGRFRDGRGPDIIHAWTTRENVRVTAEEIQRRHGGRIIIHLEDNEREILAQTLRRPWSELAALPSAQLQALITPELSHPIRSQEFLRSACGVTLILETLAHLVPAGLPHATIWPAADERYYYPRPPAAAFRAALQFAPDTTLLFYHGNAHAANAGEMRSLYEAVVLLNRTGHPTHLIRTGTDEVDFLGPLAAEVAPFVIPLGLILHHRHLPPLMAMADYFVQPGTSDAFNDYRFPSKLPEFFALGRPVILPRTNLGQTVRPGIDAYVLDQADASGIADAVRTLRSDPALVRRLSAGAAAFAAQHLSWRRSASLLAGFYLRLLTPPACPS